MDFRSTRNGQTPSLPVARRTTSLPLPISTRTGTDTSLATAGRPTSPVASRSLPTTRQGRQTRCRNSASTASMSRPGRRRWPILRVREHPATAAPTPRSPTWLAPTPAPAATAPTIWPASRIGPIPTASARICRNCASPRSASTSMRTGTAAWAMNSAAARCTWRQSTAALTTRTVMAIRSAPRGPAAPPSPAMPNGNRRADRMSPPTGSWPGSRPP